VLAANYGKLYDADPRDLPVYSAGQAAHYLHLPAATVAAWLKRQSGPPRDGYLARAAIIDIADPENNLLSFQNLTELHVLSAVRRDHGVKLKAVRRAVAFLRERLNSPHPLIARKMITDGKDLFIDALAGNLVNISQGGQMALRTMLEQFLKRIEWDADDIPIRFYPALGDQMAGKSRPILIDPRIQFGKPCLAGTRIPSSIIAERHKAGDSIKELAEDYELSPSKIKAALRYEGAAAA
jgi:uncharacterized protein (DUF433 family)